ncbi:hypothetical protein BKA64DRAFT_640918 [Cadophora sp. MPI-SDFR-AT-0126]|nr:hypothetical protein BKA64DRAFT_640918 [Leotiomycetes sp. MPI-SDFR-AT-0126]
MPATRSAARGINEETDARVLDQLKPLRNMSNEERRSEVKKVDKDKKMIDESHPLWSIYQNIPLGDGADLTNLEILVLCRVSPAERHERASKWFAKDKFSLIYSRFAPDRPPKTPDLNDKFDSLTREDFKAAGISWADMPLFASGGKKKKGKDAEKLVDYNTKMGESDEDEEM